MELRPEHVFITHLHPDHAFFVRDNRDLERQYFFLGNFRSAKQFGQYTVKPIPTHHSKKVDSQAYLIQKENTRMLYTGDLVWINKEYHPLLEHLDTVITEASFIRKGGMICKDPDTNQIYGHKGVPDLVRLLSKFTAHIVFMHFGNWFYEDIPKTTRQISRLSDEVRLTVAHDGYQFEI